MKILVTAPYHENGLTHLREQFGEVIYKPWKPHGRAYYADELLYLLKSTSANALITEHDHVTADVINAYPQLQFIGVCRGTPSNVAVQVATQHGIPVFYTPARNAQAVAEMFIANVITFMRNTLPAIEWLRGNNWAEGAHTSYLQFKGNELAGKTIGMVGFGAIGQLIADMLQCYPCPIQFYDPYVGEHNKAYRSVSLEEVFATSDIVSVHLPVTENTKGMIGYGLLSKMRSHAIFVNTARAVVVQREALLKVLEEGQIRGAILDVFDHEPPDAIDYKIIHHPNVLPTPHIAGATFEVEDHHVDILNKTLLDWFVHNKKATAKLANRELLTVQI
jgi:D-3-phosphoglycerate dehydrogenase